MNDPDGMEEAGGLPGLAAAPAPGDFALRVLRHVGIPPERYDTYVRLGTPAGGLFVAASPHAVTGAALAAPDLTATAFEVRHRSRTGRSAIGAPRPFSGVVPALRTGRAARLPIDLTGLTEAERRVLQAVRAIPAGQLRPVSWIAREADRPAVDVVPALTHNPVAVLIPCHRATHDNGRPCDAGYPPEIGDALRRSEGIDTRRMAELSAAGAAFLGSDTTHIYCHPTCAHARRITPAHRVPFRTARDARQAGFRACKSCRPLTS
ncbi:MGMT family protein [Streptomyces litchfieldiae]|uniref:Ada metal-binding domain-containing protein n=1 Tax=Streptomyces litchfieldiae TaxID=3075543 RepID=A0ABU2N0I1_9ACTN|nr:MGMT family protein [Streptomyces sp. DSM 44938]MDT0347403.1 Ada metal-binding domain-containing protein [Streptomyces sp. DSM 44938]